MDFNMRELAHIIAKTLQRLSGTRYLDCNDYEPWSTDLFLWPTDGQHWRLTVLTHGSMNKRDISVTLYKDLYGGEMEVGTAPLWHEDRIAQLFEWLHDLDQVHVTMNHLGEHDKPFFCHACGKAFNGIKHIHEKHSRPKPRDVTAGQTTLDCYLPGGQENPVEL